MEEDEKLSELSFIKEDSKKIQTEVKLFACFFFIILASY